MKRFQNDVLSVILGSNLGMTTPPLINLNAAIPAVIMRKTTASAIANADVYLNESARTRKYQLYTDKNLPSGE